MGQAGAVFRIAGIAAANGERESDLREPGVGASQTVMPFSSRSSVTLGAATGFILP